MSLKAGENNIGVVMKVEQGSGTFTARPVVE